MVFLGFSSCFGWFSSGFVGISIVFFGFSRFFLMVSQGFLRKVLCPRLAGYPRGLTRSLPEEATCFPRGFQEEVKEALS